MTPPLLFTHIPKTAGTSLKASVIYPNVPRERLYVVQGMRRLVRDRPHHAEVVMGHVPFGTHHALGRSDVRYFTILRDPVDRCVSFYNYVLMCETRNPGHPGQFSGHPALADAKRHPIDAFFALEPYRNIQTKFTAGLLWERARAVAPPWLGELAFSEARMLARAQHNLTERYWLFGLLARIDEVQDRLARALGWTNTSTRDRSRQTSGRAGGVTPTPEQREAIRQHNALDEALYAYAEAHYDAQTVGGA